MISRSLVLGAGPVLLLSLAACGKQQEHAFDATAADASPVSVSASGGMVSPVAPAGMSDAPDYAALEQVDDPARVVRFLSSALYDGRWDDAARAWGEGEDAQTLRARFDGEDPVMLIVGEGTSEGAAGSIYYSAPYVINRAGHPEEKGTIVLRRVNDVPGASQASLHWHVSSMDAET
ncbi:hypothetical protein MB02_08265 [Croceicoccus estronivorus]|uniref:hypothetical protein n=1 Tax=Croceicoccus estronivorus TaxID=1172626 RepID=UPI000832AD3D|nr:hypothetical protein [Croceicoccus estronivorus]OCC23820.1 hypothetical protein MB02_08265 [Croceicoccus estronivorus]